MNFVCSFLFFKRLLDDREILFDIDELSSIISADDNELNGVIYCRFHQPFDYCSINQQFQLDLTKFFSQGHRNYSRCSQGDVTIDPFRSENIVNESDDVCRCWINNLEWNRIDHTRSNSSSTLKIWTGKSHNHISSSCKNLLIMK